jgi:hypothetical protein
MGSPCGSVVEHAIGDGVLEGFRLFVNFGPIEPEHSHEEEFDEAVSPQNAERELLALIGKTDAPAGLVLGEPRGGERLDHGSRRPGNDAHGGRQPSHQDHLALGCALLEVELLDVVFDGAGAHARSSSVVRKSVLVTGAKEFGLGG